MKSQVFRKDERGKKTLVGDSFVFRQIHGGILVYSYINLTKDKRMFCLNKQIW